MSVQTYLIRNGNRIGFGGDGTNPPPPTINTIIGINNKPDMAFKKSKLDDRFPCARVYNDSFLPATFDVTLAQAPEKRVSYSFKNAGAPFGFDGLASGNGNARLRSWCLSIPAGWTVYLTYYHEVNDNINAGQLTGAQYTAAYGQFMGVIKNLRDNNLLNAGVTLRLCPNYMSYQLGAPNSAHWKDSWIPTQDQCDLVTFDIYGNPGQNTPSGTNKYGSSVFPHTKYDSVYPIVEDRFRLMFDILERTGWAQHWGILELNTPPRNWDGPLNPDYNPNGPQNEQYRGTAGKTEAGRTQWLIDATEHCLAPPMTNGAPPEILLYWEHPLGANWNQKFFTDNTWNAIKTYVTRTPDGSA
jgi:hypothetical protein